MELHKTRDQTKSERTCNQEQAVIYHWVWSILQNLNNVKRDRDPEEIKKKMIEARMHLAFCAEIYQIQIDAGRYYFHEHPTSAKSWKEPCIQKIINRPESFATRMHMCAHERKIPDTHGNEYIYKPTQFLTNSPLIAARLERKCDRSHLHTHNCKEKEQIKPQYTPTS